MKPFCVAITGGIGSGKSTAAKYFEMLGAELISADQISHQLCQQQTVKSELRDKFGNEIFDENNQLNRKQLASIIFNDAEQKKELEALLHPKIRKEIIERVQHSQKPYCIIEIPLLKAKADFPYINRVLCVITPHQRQVEFAHKRDNKTIAEIEQIISQQLTNEQRLQLSDDVIYNDKNLQHLQQQCQALHQSYMRH